MSQHHLTKVLELFCGKNTTIILEVKMLNRSYYSNSLETFLNQRNDAILGNITRNNEFSLEDTQKNAWVEQIKILKISLSRFDNGHILFEYTIPRMGKRVDNIFIYKGIIFILEFKVGETQYFKHNIDQVFDYGLDLKNFHEGSHDRYIAPILVATNGEIHENNIDCYQDKLICPSCCNTRELSNLIYEISQKFCDSNIDPNEWEKSRYKPTPTIVEAAQALYRGHSVKDISRSDSGAINLSITTQNINEIIDYSKAHNRKAICFITGVPGAGKTLAGLNIACSRQKYNEEEHAVFLSGNGPLVDVLQEALARDEVTNSDVKIYKTEAIRKSKLFIQNIHHFRDDAIRNEKALLEKVAIFDEAQRAWNKHKTSNFMQRKKGVLEFDMSEPEFLISVMDRHEDWTTIVCLIGGGQEINVGEAGLVEWFNALKKFNDWDVYLSSKIKDNEYVGNKDIVDYVSMLNYRFCDNLHLATSVRSFRSENVSDLVKYLLDCDIKKTKEIKGLIGDNYPICITRHICKAKDWLRNKARGSERYGIIASSGAQRLKKFGINVQYKIDAKMWFLNDETDVRSSFFLEDVATEFDVQGLELDWTCVAWDANLRYTQNTWEYKRFRGTSWQNINNIIQKTYLKNTYRVLLTRARQGMIIFVPEGDEKDYTRQKEFYDGTYEYLKKIGFIEI
jgi:hypothetical protein